MGYIVALTTSALSTQSAAAPTPGTVNNVHPVFPVISAPKPTAMQNPPVPVGYPIG